jgi:hypothetical protein
VRTVLALCAAGAVHSPALGAQLPDTTPATVPPEPELARAAPEPAQEIPERSGPFGRAGVAFVVAHGGQAALRVDLGLPILVESTPKLRLEVATTLNHSEEMDISVTSVAPFATAELAWPLLRSHKMRLAAVAEGGLGPVFAWIRIPDAPYMPAHYESETVLGGRIAGAIELATRSGFVLTAQPGGVVWNFEDVDDSLVYEIGLRGGFQLP